MFKRLCLTVCVLLGCCAGVSSVHSPPTEILAFAGKDVTLPCRFNIDPSDDPPAVEWSKEGLDPNVAFLYRDGSETYEMKNKVFEYRTSLVLKDLHKGDASLKVLNVRISDTGVYTCKILQKSAPHNETVKLVVAAVSEPKLSVVSPENGGVTLQCETGCWLPEPEVTFQDEQGRDIPAESPRREPDGGGCFTVRRRATLQRPTTRVTCRVHQQHHNQTREARVFIPADCMRSISLYILAAVGGTVLACLAVGGIYCVGRKYVKSAKAKQPVTRQASGDTIISDDHENDHEILLQQSPADTPAQADRIQSLEKEVADLKSAIQKKDETIQTLQSNLRPQSPVCQHDQPTLPDLSPTSQPPSDPTGRPTASPSKAVQSPHRRPAIQRQASIPPTARVQTPLYKSSSVSARSAENRQAHMARSFSVSSGQPGQRIAPAPRRPSLSNRYSALKDEEA